MRPECSDQKADQATSSVTTKEDVGLALVSSPRSREPNGTLPWYAETKPGPTVASLACCVATTRREAPTLGPAPTVVRSVSDPSTHWVQ